MGRAGDLQVLSVVTAALGRLSPAVEPQSAGALAMAVDLLSRLGGARQAPLEDQALEVDALRRRLAAADLIAPDTDLHIERPSAGYSKDTFLARVGDDPEAAFVVRRDVPAGTTRTTVVEEYPLLLRLFAAGLPVAEPLLLETDRQVLGEAFTVVRGVRGKEDFPVWQTDGNARRQGARELARFLATLHRVPLDGAVPPTASAATQAHVRLWNELWREVRPAHGHRHIDEAYAWLAASARAAEGAAVLVHGDVGFHNILMEGATIRAVLDWEFAHPGEAAEDLSYCRPYVEALGPWGEFLDAYAAAGGTPPSEARLAYYAVWRGVRNATCCALGASHVRQGRTLSLRIAHAGFVLIDRFSEDVRRQLDLARGPTGAREIRRRGASAP